MSDKVNQDDINKALWAACDTFRGTISADTYKDFILTMLFLKYISDHWNDHLENYRKLYGGDETRIRRRLERERFVLPEGASFYDLYESRNEPNIGERINIALERIEDANRAKLEGVFRNIDFNSEANLGRPKDRNRRLKNLLEDFAKPALDLRPSRVTEDIIGECYIYLISRFASDAGKKAGEFYTPQQISGILSEIVTLDSQDPTTGKKKKLERVFDFACGSGSLLLNVRKQLGAHGIGKIYGTEKNITTYNLARMNMLLHGVKDNEFEIYHGDSLLNDWDMFRESNPAKKMQFDAIVANPPFSYRWEPNEVMGEDFRFKNYGLAPKSAADFAFLLHGFHFLAKEGTMAIILPHGVLFRGGAEERIRTKLLKDGNIDTVIGLPSNLFFSTGIPVCILVLKKCKKYDDVLFINAAEHFEKGKRQNKLLPEHIEKIVSTYQYRKEEDRYSKRVSMEQIEAEGYNLNISRYISTATAEKEIDIKEVNVKLVDLEEKITSSTAKHNEFLRELGLDLLPL